MARNTEQPIRCSFCGKRDDEARLIAGPGVFICSECVQACSDLLREEMQFDDQGDLRAPEKLPTPMRRIGVNDVFGCSGPAGDLLKLYGLCAENIVAKAKELCK